MLIDFFLHLKAQQAAGIDAGVSDLLEALQARVAAHSIDDFYFLSRTCLVKDETQLRPVRPRLRRVLQGR